MALEFELNVEKQTDGSHLLKNKHTNEPVAYLRKPKYAYKSTSVEAEWHPDFKLLHPESNDNLIHRNFPKAFDSAAAAKAQIEGSAEVFVRGKHESDPVKSEYVGHVPGKDSYGEDVNVHKWHLFDDDKQKIGSFVSTHGPDTIHRDSPINVTWDKGYVESSNIPDSVREAALKKHAGTDLKSALQRVRYVLDNKGKEPRFIGTQAADSTESNIFKTKLEPEAASKAYEEHLRSKFGSDYTFTRHSPVSFMAHKPATSKYDSNRTHQVIAMPGQIHHMNYTTAHHEYEHGKKNTQIIESVSHLTLEELLSIYRMIR